MKGGAARGPAEGRRAGVRRGGGTITTRILQRAGRRSKLVLSLLCLLTGLVLLGSAGGAAGSTPASATEPATAGAPDPAVEHGEATASQPSIMNVNPGLMVWTVVTFVALLVALRFTAWKPLVASLEARERRIREAVEGAERARRESEAAVARQRELLEQAKADAQAIIEEGKADGLRLRETLAAQARTEAEEFMTRAKRDIELATDAAKQELFEHATRLSVEMAEKILQRSLTAQDQRRIVERIVEEFRTREEQPS